MILSDTRVGVKTSPPSHHQHSTIIYIVDNCDGNVSIWNRDEMQRLDNVKDFYTCWGVVSHCRYLMSHQEASTTGRLIHEQLPQSLQVLRKVRASVTSSRKTTQNVNQIGTSGTAMEKLLKLSWVTLMTNLYARPWAVPVILAFEKKTFFVLMMINSETSLIFRRINYSTRAFDMELVWLCFVALIRGFIKINHFMFFALRKMRNFWCLLRFVFWSERKWKLLKSDAW